MWCVYALCVCVCGGGGGTLKVPSNGRVRSLNTSDSEIMIGPLYIYRRLNGSIQILRACTEPVG